MKETRMTCSDVVGKSYRVRNGSVITVKGKTLESGISRFFCECSLCSKDPELFPPEIMTIDIRSFRSKRSPCPCSGKYQMKDWQLQIMWKRLIDDNFKFLGCYKEEGNDKCFIDYIDKTKNNKGKIRTDRFLGGIYGNAIKSKKLIEEVNKELSLSVNFPKDSKFTPDYLRGGSYWVFLGRVDQGYS